MSNSKSGLSTKNTSTNRSLQLDDQLFELFRKLIPLIDNVSDGVRAIALLGVLISAWLFIWIFFILHGSLTSALIVSGIAFVPCLVLLRYWWALESVKDLPAIAEEMVDDVTEDVKTTWREVKSDKKKALNFIGQVKNIWEMKSLLGELDDVFSQYLNFGILINPLSLTLSVFSLLAILVLLLVAFVTLLTSIF